MNKLLKSKGVAAGLLILVIILLVATFSIRMSIGWWAFSDIFFAFMAAFCHLMSQWLGQINQRVGSKLDRVAFVCFILFVVALIVEYIIYAL